MNPFDSKPTVGPKWALQRREALMRLGAAMGCTRAHVRNHDLLAPAGGAMEYSWIWLQSSTLQSEQDQVPNYVEHSTAKMEWATSFEHAFRSRSGYAQPSALYGLLEHLHHAAPDFPHLFAREGIPIQVMLAMEYCNRSGHQLFEVTHNSDNLDKVEPRLRHAVPELWDRRLAHLKADDMPLFKGLHLHWRNKASGAIVEDGAENCQVVLKCPEF